MPTQQTPTPGVKPTDWAAMAALASDDITDAEAETLTAAMAGEPADDCHVCSLGLAGICTTDHGAEVSR